MIRHIVMWRVRADSAAERSLRCTQVKQAFESLRGKIPGMTHLEIGIDTSAVDYACDAVLLADFESTEALQAYASHPAHLQVRNLLEGVRISRHQVDYEVQP